MLEKEINFNDIPNSILQVNNTFSEFIPALADEEFAQLEQNILADGIREPVCIWNGVIIDGHNRYTIARKHNLPFNTCEMNFEDENQAKMWIIKNQLGRRNIFDYSRGELALQLKDMFAAEAKKNQGARRDILPNLAKCSINTRKEVAKIAGLSHGNIAKVEFIKDRAAEPVKEQLRRGEVAIDRVYQNLKNEERRENIKTAAAVMPDGVFNVIYADPPWKYGHSRSDSRAIEGKYPTEELEDIKNLQIPTADDAVLFLWATAPKLPEAIEVMKAWGFEYKTSAVWDKMINGEGYWFRGRHELLMVGVKGEVSPPEAGKHTGSVYEEECDEENTPDSVYKKKRGEHSVKPEYYYQMIEEMFPYGKYLELFARQRYSDKWAVYGNQVE